MDAILLIAAVLIASLVFTILIKVVKAAISTALWVAVLVLVLQLAFGISPNQWVQRGRDLWEAIDRFLPGH